MSLTNFHSTTTGGESTEADWVGHVLISAVVLETLPADCQYWSAMIFLISERYDARRWPGLAHSRESGRCLRFRLTVFASYADTD